MQVCASQSINNLNPGVDNEGVVRRGLLEEGLTNLIRDVNRKSHMTGKHEIERKDRTNTIGNKIRRAIPIVNAREDSSDRFLMLIQIEAGRITGITLEIGGEQLVAHSIPLNRVGVHANSNTIGNLVDLRPRRKTTKIHAVYNEQGQRAGNDNTSSGGSNFLKGTAFILENVHVKEQWALTRLKFADAMLNLGFESGEASRILEVGGLIGKAGQDLGIADRGGHIETCENGPVNAIKSFLKGHSAAPTFNVRSIGFGGVIDDPRDKTTKVLDVRVGGKDCRELLTITDVRIDVMSVNFDSGKNRRSSSQVKHPSVRELDQLGVGGAVERSSNSNDLGRPTLGNVGRRGLEVSVVIVVNRVYFGVEALNNLDLTINPLPKKGSNTTIKTIIAFVDTN
jgi:hypothetical protein